MGVASYRICYRQSSATTNISLYTSSEDVGLPCLAVRANGSTLYAKLGSTGDSNASRLRVKESGTTYAVLTQAGAETFDPATKSLQFTVDSSSQLYCGPNMTLSDTTGSTIEFWWKITGLGSGSQSVFQSSNAQQVFLGMGTIYSNPWVGRNASPYWTSLGTNTGLSADSTWKHIAIVNKSGVSYLYVDGTQTGSSTLASATGLAGRFYFGNPPGWSTAWCFGGNLSDIRFWSVERTAQQINDNMGIRIGAQSGLEAYYKLDQSSGTTATDSSGNGRDGTITSCTWV